VRVFSWRPGLERGRASDGVLAEPRRRLGFATRPQAELHDSMLFEVSHGFVQIVGREKQPQIVGANGA
jgi:hypothetical protein